MNIVIIADVIIVALSLFSAVMFMIGSGLLIASGRLLKSNQFGNWSCDNYDYDDIKIRYRCYKDKVPDYELEDFINEYGDTKNWK
ncbi:MAG: hypothetical protein K6G47_00370 [Clostridia bacterium]|nr:hypothetical protein [Clostridia bacterium]